MDVMSILGYEDEMAGDECSNFLVCDDLMQVLLVLVEVDYWLVRVCVRLCSQRFWEGWYVSWADLLLLRARGELPCST